MAIRIATMALIMAILIAINGNANGPNGNKNCHYGNNHGNTNCHNGNAKWPYMAMLMAIKAN